MRRRELQSWAPRETFYLADKFSRKLPDDPQSPHLFGKELVCFSKEKEITKIRHNSPFMEKKFNRETKEVLRG